MNEIKNYSVYNERMNASINDKLFFLRHLNNDITTVVDYGCADGALGLALAKESNLNYYGFDIDKKMLDIANANGISANNLFYDFDALLQRVDVSKTILILSSVIHEVYSYCGKYEIEQFWNRVLNSGFKMVSIRDMGLENNKIAYGKINPLNAVKVTNKIFERNNDYIPMNYFKDYYQLLLKYWYTENWARESKEDYFPITLSEIQTIIADSDYNVDRCEPFCVPYVVNKVKKDLGISLNETTHYKIILTL